MRSRESLLRLHRFRTDDLRRQVGETDLMIQDLMRKHDELDAHVKSEEARNGVSDPNHVNYSMAAKAVRSRRDNILRTVAELRDQHEAMQTRYDEEAAELRKIELMVEKEGGSHRSSVVPAGNDIGQTAVR